MSLKAIILHKSNRSLIKRLGIYFLKSFAGNRYRELKAMNSIKVMLQIKHIKDSRFEVNRRDAKFFHEKGILMTPDEQRDFLSNNIAIGYCGKHFTLRRWADQQCKGLPVRNFPGETVEEKRQLLWQAVKANKVERWLVKLADQLKQDKVVTIYYLSVHDKPVAELVQRFLTWYIKQ